MRRSPADRWSYRATSFVQAKQQLTEYFSGERHQFSLLLDLQGTPFQQQVWSALQTIPYGTTCSYSDVARTIDRPKAVQAVGNANSSNPIPIIIPCHRVIAKDGSLSGFGGGSEIKLFLLQLEQQFYEPKTRNFIRR